MRIERISNDQFKIFLTFDDLVERGFTKEDIWQDVQRVKTLFSEMMHEASEELGFELEGVLLVQVHLMQAQGMHIFVTQKTDNEDDWFDDFIEMKVTLDESKELVFCFDEFEDLIQASFYLNRISITGGSVYYIDDAYYILFKESVIRGVERETIIAILSEFASPSIVTEHRLCEYGKAIIHKNAINTIQMYFK